MKYDPNHGPDPVLWLELDESERIFAIQQYHKRAKQPVGESPMAHASIHAAVETQLAEGHASATAALTRLLAEGLSRHEAIHAIGSILSTEIYEVLKFNRSNDPDLYARRLDALTAETWLSSSG